MTNYLLKSFSVGMSGDDKYRDNWDRIFGAKCDDKVVCPVCDRSWNRTSSETCPWCGGCEEDHKEGIGY